MCLKSHVPFDMNLGFGASSSELLQCVVCKINQPADRVTAGSITAAGVQSVACYAHIYTKATWLLGWAEFEMEQQSIRGLQGEVPRVDECGVVIERRVGLNASEQAADIARHLQVRQALGAALVITERPSIFLSMVRKQWLKIERVLQRERASTFDKALKREFTRQIEAMQGLHFVARAYDLHPNADVMFVTPEMAQALVKRGKTVYISAVLQHEELYLSVTQEGGVVVDYACNV